MSNNKPTRFMVDLKAPNGGLLCINKRTIKKVTWNPVTKEFIAVMYTWHMTITHECAWDLIEKHDIPADPIPDSVRAEDHPNE